MAFLGQMENVSDLSPAVPLPSYPCIASAMHVHVFEMPFFHYQGSKQQSCLVPYCFCNVFFFFSNSGHTAAQCAKYPSIFRGVPIPRLLRNTDLNKLNMQQTNTLQYFMDASNQSIAYMTKHTRTQQLLIIRYAVVAYSKKQHFSQCSLLCHY